MSDITPHFKIKRNLFKLTRIVCCLGRDPVEVLPELSSSTPTAAGLNDQVVSLWLPQVLELLLIRPVPHLPLSLLGLVQVVQDRVLPRLEAVPVHEPALGAG